MPRLVAPLLLDDEGEGPLEQVCALADEHGVELVLEVESLDEEDAMTREELGEWYWRFGFRGKLDEMIREPRQSERES